MGQAHIVATGAVAFVRAMVRWGVYVLLHPLFSPASSQLAAREQRYPGDSLSRSASCSLEQGRGLSQSQWEQAE